MSHINLAIGEKGVQNTFNSFIQNFHEVVSKAPSGGVFRAGYSAGVRIPSGKIELQNGSIKIDELDILFDPLILNLQVDIPSVTVGGFCIIPTPFGCALRAPRITFFGANPDINLTIDLSAIIQSEISGAVKPVVKYKIDPGRTPSMSYLDAEDAGKSDKWQVFADPIWIDLDLVDIADTVGNILDRVIRNAADQLLSFLPGWARDIVLAILGGFVSLIRRILDIGDDVAEWLSNLLGTSLGLFNTIVNLVLDYFAKKYPLFEFENPYPVLPYQGSLIPVKIPLREIKAQVTEDELTVTGDISPTI